MTETTEVQTLTPRQQFVDMMHKYAQANGLPYGESWREFERRYEKRHRIKVSYMKWSYCRDHQVRLTMPAFLETTEHLDEALAVAHEMIGSVLKGESCV